MASTMALVRHARRAEGARGARRRGQAAASRGGGAAALPAVHAVPLPAAAARLALPRRRTTRACSTRPTRCAPRAPSSATGAGATSPTRRRSTRCRSEPQTVFRVQARGLGGRPAQGAVRRRPRALDRSGRLRRVPGARAHRARGRRAGDPLRVGARPEARAVAWRCSTLPASRSASRSSSRPGCCRSRASASSGRARTRCASETFDFPADAGARGARGRGDDDLASAQAMSDATHRRAHARAHRLRGVLARDARVHRRAHARHARRDVADRARADLHARPGRPPRAPDAPNAIPVLKVDRGGQVTYHGPGQLVAYVLVDLARAQLGIRAMVRRLEEAVVQWLDSSGISAYGKTAAPGVYVSRDGVEAKIAALGLKVRNGCTYHGLAVNVAMDLAPFADIDPCGYPGPRGHAARRPRRPDERRAGRRDARADPRAHASPPTP